MDKYGFPIVLFLIILCLYSLFKPTVYNTYVDQDYLKSLRTCKTHVSKGKLPQPNNISSMSIVRGPKQGKCVIQTINEFSKEKLSYVCSLNKYQLADYIKVRESRVFTMQGYNDTILLKKFIKEGACKTYKFEDNKWVVTSK